MTNKYIDNAEATALADTLLNDIDLAEADTHTALAALADVAQRLAADDGGPEDEILDWFVSRLD